ncbi:MAG: hypothetical protein PVF83_12925 [Anaerolineales bacterium]
MSLIDRYIHEVGRYLPRKNRADIQAELRSLVADTIEDRGGGEPTEADVAAILKEFGPPKKVAASYFPEGQYLIGPTLFPVFKLVAVIAIASVIGAQLLSVGIAVFFTDTRINIIDFFTGIITSIPIVLGLVVVAFTILQWFDVKGNIQEKSWEPHQLPEITDFESVKTWERIVGIIGAMFILGFLAFYPDRIGIIDVPGGNFFDNPVIVQYLGTICLVLILSIILDIYLLWQGRWQTLTRVAKVIMGVFSIIILVLLVQGHTAWLVERDASWLFISNLGELPEGIVGTQVIGMQVFRMVFGITLIITIIDTIVIGFRLIRVNTLQDLHPLAIPIKNAEDTGSTESR